MNPIARQIGEISSRSSIRSAVSDSFLPEQAVKELADSLALSDPACVLFFCSPQYDLHALGHALNKEFAGCQLVGCTTAGEISRRGLTANSICAVALDRLHFEAEALLLDDVAFADADHIRELVDGGLQRLDSKRLLPIDGNSFAFSLLDGLSIREEIMLPVIKEALGATPLIGGSAADAMDFHRTHIFFDGAFHENAAVIVLFNTRCPFEIISGHHFAPTEEKLVVTSADPEQRVVLEFNAEPAALEYCRVMNLSLDDLSPHTFALNPLGVQLGENLFARSIRQVNDDLSLTFFCAIDHGIILTALKDTGMLDHFKSTMRSVCNLVGEPQAVIAADCIHRLYEAEAGGKLSELSDLYGEYNVVGFNTYGEQRDGLHINHSFTGIAFGYPYE